MNEISSYYSDCFSCKYLLIHSFLCMYKILSATLYRAWKLNDYIDVLLHTIFIFYSRHLQAMTNSLSVLHCSIHIFFRIVCLYLISVTHLISSKQFSMCKTAGVWKWNYKEDFFWNYDWYALLMDYSMLQFELINMFCRNNLSSILKNTLWIMQAIKSLFLITKFLDISFWCFHLEWKWMNLYQRYTHYKFPENSVCKMYFWSNSIENKHQRNFHIKQYNWN